MLKVTAADILKVVPITRKTLWLWQKKYKFFPDPIKQVHPGGKGIVGYYPAWVKERCSKVYNLQQKGYTVDLIKEVLYEEEQIKTAKKVLIVDSEKKMVSLLKKYFMKNGYMVEVAYDCLDAGLKVTSFMPAIIFLDVGFPGVKGVEVCQRLKSYTKTQDIRIIAVSNDLNLSEKPLLDAGAEFLMKKPLNIEQLMEKCNLLLSEEKRIIETSISIGPTS